MLSFKTSTPICRFVNLRSTPASIWYLVAWICKFPTIGANKHLTRLKAFERTISHSSGKWHQNMTPYVLVFLTSSLSRFVAVSFPCLLASSRVSCVVSRIEGAGRAEERRDNRKGKEPGWEGESTLGKVEEKNCLIDCFFWLTLLMLLNEEIQKHSFSTHVFLRYVLVITITTSSSYFRLKNYTKTHGLTPFPGRRTCCQQLLFLYHDPLPLRTHTKQADDLCQLVSFNPNSSIF